MGDPQQGPQHHLAPAQGQPRRAIALERRLQVGVALVTDLPPKPETRGGLIVLSQCPDCANVKV
eukprot:2913143-Pleurochrysis_carterae.AAC.2